jgi:allantoinase
LSLRGHGRFPYSAITRRPDWSWPGGGRLAVYIALNLEHFAFGQGLGAALAPGGPEPDVLNHAWREYGNRVGVWRMLDLFQEFDLPVSVLVNSEIYDHCPEVMDAFRARGDEVVGHGRANAERQGVLDETAERALIGQATDIIKEREGTAPRGWLGPWISESGVTPDLLQEAGYDYLLDWCMDDQPVWMTTRAGRILSVPYPQELNDIPQIVARKIEGAAFADMIIDGFNEQSRQSAKQPLVFGIALHAYVMGQPHRLPHLRRVLEHIHSARDRIWLCRTGEIAAAFQERAEEGAVISHHAPSC